MNVIIFILDMMTLEIKFLRFLKFTMSQNQILIMFLVWFSKRALQLKKKKKYVRIFLS